MKERYSDSIPKWLKMLGAWRINKDSIDFKWGYFAPRFGFCLHNDWTYEDGIPCIHFTFIWGQFAIELPFIPMRRDDVNNHPRYGFDYHGQTFWIHYGMTKDTNWPQDRWYTFHMPWTYDFVKHTILNPDGSVYCDAKNLSNSFNPPERTIEVHDYRYILASGEVQDRKATIFGEEREYCMKAFKWLGFPKKIYRSIDISFDQEIGEGIRTWKGGTVGCSNDWKHDETMFECLKRMEFGRKFT